LCLETNTHFVIPEKVAETQKFNGFLQRKARKEERLKSGNKTTRPRFGLKKKRVPYFPQRNPRNPAFLQSSQPQLLYHLIFFAMFSVRAARLCRGSVKSFSDAAAAKVAQAPKVVAQAPKVATPAAPVAAATSGVSTLGQRLSSCLVGMAIGYR
jgi:hypothetical protein